MVDYKNQNFSSLYKPKQGVAMDESVVKFCGRLSFIQQNSTKRARLGLKYYTMYEI
jgi:hypothetical protein